MKITLAVHASVTKLFTLYTYSYMFSIRGSGASMATPIGHLPGDALLRVFDALEFAARASACCVCRAWSVDAAIGWQRAAEVCAEAVAGLSP